MARGTIREERPDLLKYLDNKEDGELTCGSGKKIEVKCPECGFKKEMTVAKLTKSFYCNNCNSIKNKRPDLLKYLVNEQDGNLTYGCRKKIKVKCSNCNFTKDINMQDFIRNGFGCENPICINYTRTTQYRFKEGQTVNGMVVLKQIKMGKKNNNCRGYTLRCLIDETEHQISEYNLINQKSGCSVCSGKKIVKGINDIATTHPYLIQYLKNKEDGFKYTFGSGKSISMICPICKTEKEMKICNLVNSGFSCSACSDGNSYPNKFMERLIKQSGIEFFTEKRFDWVVDDNTYKIYDIYIPSLNCIIENHGRQHYKNNGFTKLGGRTLEEEQKNDKVKKELALQNGIKNYFEIDCRKSKLEWIKTSVIKSKLLNLLELKECNVDWLDCHSHAINSKVIIACELWNKKKSVKEISKILNIHSCTVLVYLRQGKKINLCDYNEQESWARGYNINSKKVYVDDKIFNSIVECATYYDINESTMRGWINSKVNMPEKFYNMGLRLENKNIDDYNVRIINSGVRVICDNKIFRSMKECCDFYNENYSTMSHWMKKRCKTPQKYIDLGLRYATEEDLNTYEIYNED